MFDAFRVSFWISIVVVVVVVLFAPNFQIKFKSKTFMRKKHGFGLKFNSIVTAIGNKVRKKTIMVRTHIISIAVVLLRYIQIKLKEQHNQKVHKRSRARRLNAIRLFRLQHYLTISIKTSREEHKRIFSVSTFGRFIRTNCASFQLCFPFMWISQLILCGRKIQYYGFIPMCHRLHTTKSKTENTKRK